MKKTALAVILALGFSGGLAPLSTIAAPAPQQGGHRPSRAAIEKLHAQLRLNPHQETAWQKIRTDQQRLRHEFRAHRDQVRKVVTEELAKAQPDLNHVAAVQARGQVQLRAHGRALRREMLAFYNALSPRQKTAVRGFLRARFERLQSSRQSTGQ